MKYSERIRSLREDRDLTQSQIADMLQVGQRTYCDYELGKTRIPVDSLIILAKFYNVSLDYLTGIIDYPIPLTRSETATTSKANESTCVISIPGEEKIKKTLTPKQAELLKKYIEILTK